MPYGLDGGRGERHLRRSIDRALAGRSRLSRAALRVPGLSTPTIRHLLNNVCALRGVRYLEVGCWKGGSLIAASYGNRGRFLGIDNLSLLGATGGGLRRTLRYFAHRSAAEFKEADCWSVDPRRLGAPFNVYYYDGAHRYDDHYRAVVHFEPALARRFVLLVDDWNIGFIRRATRDAIRDLGLEVLAETEFRTRGLQCPEDLWWNGFFVGLLARPARSRTRAYPVGSRGGVV